MYSSSIVFTELQCGFLRRREEPGGGGREIHGAMDWESQATWQMDRADEEEPQGELLSRSLRAVAVVAYVALERGKKGLTHRDALGVLGPYAD